LFHDFIFVALLSFLEVDSIGTTSIVVNNSLLPNVEIQTLLRVVVHPLISFWEKTLAIIHVLNIEVLVVLSSLLNSGPL
jgi:hypothetical protein